MTLRPMFKHKPEQIGVIPEEDKQRLFQVFVSAAPTTPIISGMGQRDYVEAWITEHRMNAERRATRRLTIATWVLALATVALVFATFVLAHVTAVHH
jgi:hypothetical protein